MKRSAELRWPRDLGLMKIEPAKSESESYRKGDGFGPAGGGCSPSVENGEGAGATGCWFQVSHGYGFSA